MSQKNESEKYESEKYESEKYESEKLVRKHVTKISQKMGHKNVQHRSQEIGARQHKEDETNEEQQLDKSLSDVGEEVNNLNPR